MPTPSERATGQTESLLEVNFEDLNTPDQQDKHQPSPQQPSWMTRVYSKVLKLIDSAMEVDDRNRLKQLQAVLKRKMHEASHEGKKAVGTVTWSKEKENIWTPQYKEKIDTNGRSAKIPANLLIKVLPEISNRLISVYLNGKEIAHRTDNKFRIFGQQVDQHLFEEFIHSLRKICKEARMEYKVFEPRMEDQQKSHVGEEKAKERR
jgi:hypothetical protein